MSQAEEARQRHAARKNDNLRSAQRWGALVGGSALALYGLTRRSSAGLLLAAGGGTLAYFGVRTNGAHPEQVARASVLVNCTRQEAFRFWRNFENLPRFMRQLESVKVSGDKQSHWVAVGPMGTRFSWNAEIGNERENELIAWRSLPGSDFELEGIVEFSDALGERGTLISCAISCLPRAGQLSSTLAKGLRKGPSFLMQQDLRRFKALLETGEIPTIEGQPHGPRRVVTAAARAANPDSAWLRSASFGEVLRSERRAS